MLTARNQNQTHNSHLTLTSAVSYTAGSDTTTDWLLWALCLHIHNFGHDSVYNCPVQELESGYNQLKLITFIHTIQPLFFVEYLYCCKSLIGITVYYSIYFNRTFKY